MPFGINENYYTAVIRGEIIVPCRMLTKINNYIILVYLPTACISTIVM